MTRRRPWYERSPGARRLATAAIAAVALVPGVGASPAAAQDVVSLASFGWLSGCWAGTLSSGAVYEEWWMPEAGGTMLGMSRLSRDGRTLSFEFLRIAVDGNDPVYFAQPGGREPTAFRLSSDSGGSAVFENPGHDFPQRIVYGRPESGAPFARIEGERGGEVRRLDFPLSRVSCPGGDGGVPDGDARRPRE